MWISYNGLTYPLFCIFKLDLLYINETIIIQRFVFTKIRLFYITITTLLLKEFSKAFLVIRYDDCGGQNDIYFTFIKVKNTIRLLRFNDGR